MTKEKKQSLLESCKNRMPFPVFNQVYKEYSVNKKLSKKKISGDRRTYDEKIQSLRKVLLDSDFDKFFKELECTYRENILYGSKYIKYYRFNKVPFNKLMDHLEKIKLTSNAFSKSHPYVLSEGELKNVMSGDLMLVEHKKHQNSLMLVFSRKVDFVERVPIDSKEINSKDLVDTYTEFFGVKHYKRQFIDTVFLNKKERTIEFRIDHFNYTSDAQSERNFNDFLKMFLDILPSQLANEFNKSINELNLHSVIKKLNNDRSGRLVEICFSTKEGSNIKIKRRKGDCDIREEAYHKAGSKAVLNKLDIYRIGTIWRNQKDNELELLIPGSSRLVNDSLKHINETIITKCRGAADFNLINSKVYNFINN